MAEQNATLTPEQTRRREAIYALATELDAYELLVQARAQISGRRTMTVDSSDEGMSLTGYELDNLLLPINQRLNAVLMLLNEFD